MKKTTIRIACVLLIIWGVIVLINSFSAPAAPLGVIDGKLADCPESPNCVCSMASDEEHAAAPISFNGDLSEAMKIAKEIIEQTPGWQIVSKENDYLHVTATTTFMRYVDDVELYFDEGSNQLHFRSASRIGYSDLGVNRNRMEAFRSDFESRMQVNPGKSE